MLSMVYVKLKTEVRVMRNGDAARAASGSGVAAPGHEPVEDDQLLRRGRLLVARQGGDEIQLPARQQPIALKAEVTGPAPIDELLRGWVLRPLAGGRHQELVPGQAQLLADFLRLARSRQRLAVMVRAQQATYPRQPSQIDERSHTSSAEGASAARRSLTVWRIPWVVVRVFGSVNWGPLTS